MLPFPIWLFMSLFVLSLTLRVMFILALYTIALQCLKSFAIIVWKHWSQVIFALILGLSNDEKFNRLPDMQNNLHYLVRKTPQKMIVQWHNCGRWKHWICISFQMQKWAPLFIHSNNLLFISFPLTKAHYNHCLSQSPEGNSDKVRMKPSGREAC